MTPPLLAMSGLEQNIYRYMPVLLSEGGILPFASSPQIRTVYWRLAGSRNNLDIVVLKIKQYPSSLVSIPNWLEEDLGNEWVFSFPSAVVKGPSCCLWVICPCWLLSKWICPFPGVPFIHFHSFIHGHLLSALYMLGMFLCKRDINIPIILQFQDPKVYWKKRQILKQLHRVLRTQFKVPWELALPASTATLPGGLEQALWRGDAQPDL